jgi:signal transduction histidine kinase
MIGPMKHIEIFAGYFLAIVAGIGALYTALTVHHETIHHNIEHTQQIVQSVFDERSKIIRTTAFDYSVWDDTIEKASIQKDHAWAKANIGDYLLDTFDISHSFLMNAQNKTIMAFGDKSEETLSQILNSPLAKDAIRLTQSQPAEAPKSFSFFLTIKDTIYLGGVSALTYEKRLSPRQSVEKNYLILVKKFSSDDIVRISKSYLETELSTKTLEHGHPIEIYSQDGRSKITFYFPEDDQHFEQILWDYAPVTIMLISLLYLTILLHKKSNQLSQTNLELTKTNQKLQNLNQSLEDKIKEQTFEIEEKVQKAEAANTAKSVFLSNMSHEFRTPLNGILGFAQMLDLNKDKNLTEKQQSWIDQIMKAGTMLLDIVNDVLDLAKIESGHTEYEPELLNPIEIIEECQTLLKPLADKRGVHLSLNTMDTDQVYCDPSKLKQTLLNLTNNAIKYSKENGDVIVGCHMHNDTTIEFYVKDNGLGIPEDEIERIFEPFHRVNEITKNIEGTGVGLSIVKTNVELMNGKISLDSTYGEGSCFTILLPIAQKSDYQI